MNAPLDPVLRDQWWDLLWRRQAKKFLQSWKAAGEPLGDDGGTWLLANALRSGLTTVVPYLLSRGALSVPPLDSLPALKRTNTLETSEQLANVRLMQQALVSAHWALLAGDGRYRPYPAEARASSIDVRHLEALEKVQPLSDHPTLQRQFLSQWLRDRTLPLVKGWVARHGDAWVRQLPQGNYRSSPRDLPFHEALGVAAQHAQPQTVSWLLDLWENHHQAHASAKTDLFEASLTLLHDHGGHHVLAQALAQRHPKRMRQVFQDTTDKGVWARVWRQQQRHWKEDSHWDEKGRVQTLATTQWWLGRGLLQQVDDPYRRAFFHDLCAHAPLDGWGAIVDTLLAQGVRWTHDGHHCPPHLDDPLRWPRLQALGWDPNQRLSAGVGSLASWVVLNEAKTLDTEPDAERSSHLEAVWERLTEWGVDWHAAAVPEHWDHDDFRRPGRMLGLLVEARLDPWIDRILAHTPERADADRAQMWPWVIQAGRVARVRQWAELPEIQVAEATRTWSTWTLLSQADGGGLRLKRPQFPQGHAPASAALEILSHLLALPFWRAQATTLTQEGTLPWFHLTAGRNGPAMWPLLVRAGANPFQCTPQDRDVWLDCFERHLFHHSQSWTPEVLRGLIETWSPDDAPAHHQVVLRRLMSANLEVQEAHELMNTLCQAGLRWAADSADDAAVTQWLERLGPSRATEQTHAAIAAVRWQSSLPTPPVTRTRPRL